MLAVLCCLNFAEAASKKSGDKRSDELRRHKALEKKQQSRLEFSAVRWHTELTRALKEAQRTNKNILLLVTGSDWCPPCKALEKKVFSHKDFAEIAPASLVLLKADFPRRKAQSAEEKKQARAIVKKYPVRGYPTVFMLSPTGKILEKKVGFGGGSAKSYLKSFRSFKQVKNKNKK